MTLIDEEVSDIPFDGSWDLVGITGYISQARRMYEIADEFRRRGQLVAIGGPYATLSTHRVRPHCDILFIGEAEQTWPQFLNEFRANAWQTEYRANGNVDLATSPPPKVEAMKAGAYWVGVVQTSRGCPYQCEFCDVIVYLGRKQRYKSPERVVEELDKLYELGYRSVFLSDDNFTAIRKKATQTMEAVGAWNHAKPERTYFATQLSIDVVRDEELVDLCAWAGLKQAFVGIESPTEEALRDVKKTQNLRGDLINDVHTLHRKGIMVNGGIITGFDTDTEVTFRRSYDFVQAAGFPMVNVNMLHAPEGTPLEERMRSEGRLLDSHTEVTAFATNVVPKLMTLEELQDGTKWLLNKLYRPESLLERLETLAKLLPVPIGPINATGTRSADIWVRLIESFKALGPEHAEIPRRAIRMFRGKDTSSLMAALLYARQAIGVMMRRGIYDPDLGRLDLPRFRKLAS